MKTVLRSVIALLIIFVISCQASPTSDVKQLELAANQGNVEAMMELGKVYENGVGVIQNYVEAHKWYNIATSRGYVKAHKARDAIAKKMSVTKIEKAQELAANWKPSKVAGAKAKDKKQTPLEQLFKATRDGDVQKVKALLKSGTDPNIEISRGIPILFVAVHENQKAVVEVLIESGADVNAPLKKGRTLLMIAIKAGHRDIAKFLIEKGAKLDVKSGKGDTPLSLAEAKGQNDIVALIMKTGGFVEPVKTLPPETIFRAAENGDVDMLRKLLDQGVDPNMTDRKGWFPLMFAAYSGHKEAVETLIDAGAEIDKQAPDASTALITATLQGNVFVVETLIKKGADKSVQNSHAMTALTIARQKGYDKVAGLLRINLRSSYKTLDQDEVKAMLKKYNFFDKYKNEKGGFDNDYDLKMFAGSEVVIDNATGLMWHQSGSDKYMNWGQAKQWVKDLNRKRYAGYSDWRLPTVEEAASLLEPNQNNDKLYIDSIFDSKQNWIWTGDRNGSGGAWRVIFGSGNVNWSYVQNAYYVRPVRSGN